MNTRLKCFSKAARTGLMLSTLLLAGTYSTVSEAAQGCGYGWHRTYHGCVRNGGPAVAHVYRQKQCWRNFWGHIRCK